MAKRVSRAITEGRGMAEHRLAQKAWAVLGSFTEGRLAVPQPRGAQGTRWVDRPASQDCVGSHMTRQAWHGG